MNTSGEHSHHWWRFFGLAFGLGFLTAMTIWLRPAAADDASPKVTSVQRQKFLKNASPFSAAIADAAKNKVETLRGQQSPASAFATQKKGSNAGAAGTRKSATLKPTDNPKPGVNFQSN